jgi:hypothetical protein
MAQLQNCVVVLVLGANSHTAGQDITRLLWNWKVYYGIQQCAATKNIPDPYDSAT